VSVSFAAFEPHFLDHILPIYHALRDATGEEYPWYAAKGLDKAPPHTIRKQPVEPGLYVVSSIGDMHRCPQGSRFVFVEHGAGQSYRGDRGAASHPSYSGGNGREDVVLFITPGPGPYARNRMLYPDARHEMVGCPKLDRWHKEPPKPMPSEPVVAITFHFESRVAPEARGAWSAYKHGLPWLAERYTLVGHAHPRMLHRVEGYYRQWNIPVFEDLEDVFDNADVFLADNSSAAWEFMSLDRPVVWLNAPWYRRDVEHGLRFWKLADSGVQVDERRYLVRAVEEAIADSPEQKERRRRAIEEVYAFRDGRASERAAAAIIEVMEEEVERRGSGVVL